MLTEEQCRFEQWAEAIYDTRLLKDENGNYRGQVLQQLWQAWQAALTQPASAALKLPDGWKLVPVEPTEDMLVNGFESKPDERFSDPTVWAEYDAMSGCQQAAHRALLCWQAMLLAAPAVPHTAPIEPICATGGAEWVKVSDVEIEQELISLQNGNGQLRGESFYREALKELLAMRSMPIPDEFLNAQQNASGMFEISEDCMCQLLNMLCSKP